MKRVLVIATGGTIASAEEGSGLAPALTGEQLVAFVPEVAQVCHVEVSQVMNVDSTNMRPEGWLSIAGEVRRSYDDFDGFVVLHGTDTLAYTAAGLSYLVQGRPKPIVLTGSQLPMGDPETDGKRNLLDAVRVACDDAAAGVMVAFGGKVISGTAARKVRTRSFEAFDSLNALDLGRVRDGLVTWADGVCERMCVAARACAAEEVGGAPSAARFYDELNPRVAVLKLTPGMDALVVDAHTTHDPQYWRRRTAACVRRTGGGGLRVGRHPGVRRHHRNAARVGGCRENAGHDHAVPVRGRRPERVRGGSRVLRPPGRAHGRQRYHRGAVGEDHVGACASGRPRRRRR